MHAVDTAKLRIDRPLRSVSERVTAACGAIAFSVGAVFIAAFDPSRSNFFPVCPLLSLTGMACPGCGLTRGFHALSKGELLTALDYNALIPVVAAFAGFLFLSMVLLAVRGRGIGLGRMSVPAVWTVLGLMLVFGVVRNLPYYPFSILFP